VTLFSAHGDVVNFHVLPFKKLFKTLPYCNLSKNEKKEKKGKKRKKKGTPPWYVKVGGHPMESVSHGL
jgi:hypothetical protein